MGTEPGTPHGRPRSSGQAPTTTGPTIASLIALAALTAQLPACDAPSPPGQLRFAIAADTCAAYCLTAVRVTLYEEADSLPLGPPLQASCASDDALVFTTLPAGLRVEAAVDGFDLTGDTLMTGRSAVVTIAASRQTDLTIPLTATTRPTITSAEPDPIAPSLSPTLTVLGEHLGPLGDYGLLLDDQPLTATFTPASDDGPDQVTTTLSDQTGSALFARRCGVASDPYPLRVVADTPGTATVTGLPLCGGAPVAAGHADPYTVIAWRCEAAANSQLVVMTDGTGATAAGGAATVCPLDPTGAWPLGATPTGPLALGHDASTPAAWVALPDKVARVDLTTGSTTTLPVVATALATTSTNTWAIADQLVELHDDGTTTLRPDLFPELDFIALASAPTSDDQPLWVAATTTAPSPQGRLVSVPSAATPTAYPLPCAPTALVASEQTVALACPDRLVLWDVTSATATPLNLSPSALALPSDATDTVFALTAGGLAHVDLAPSPTVLVTTPISGDTVTALGSHRLLVHTRDTTTVRVLTPYNTRGPCP